jgi:hypothetical protein
MLTSRRDYILRIIDEVGRLLARAVFKRKDGADQEALETIVTGFERLFSLDGDQIFLLTPEHHYGLLTSDPEAKPEDARDKVLLYAALSAEAGDIYSRQGNRALARATRLNALRFTLRAQLDFPPDGLPAYMPDPKALLVKLADEPLDAESAELVRQAGLKV